MGSSHMASLPTRTCTRPLARTLPGEGAPHGRAGGWVDLSGTLGVACGDRQGRVVTGGGPGSQRKGSGGVDTDS